jgi:hypothetical protein
MSLWPYLDPHPIHTICWTRATLAGTKADMSVNGSSGNFYRTGDFMGVAVGDVAELAAVTSTVGKYMAAAKSGTGADMKKAFYENATCYGYVGEKLAFAGPIQALCDWHETNGKAHDVNALITNIDLVGTIAHVRVEAENWTGLKFTDMFLLLKLDGRWAIVNKVFHLHAQ